MDTLKAMKVFAAVIDTGSQSAAADRLDLSRAVVSRAIAALEAWAGTRLLHRTTRRLSLTAAGEAILLRCQRMLEIEEEVHQATPTLAQRPHGRLRVTAPTAFAQAQLARIVSGFLEREPGVSIDLLLLDRPVNLVEERIDLAIRVAAELDPNLIARKLTVCRSVLCAAPGYLASHATIRRAQDLSSHNCLAHAHYGNGVWNLETEDGPVAVAVNGSLTVNDATTLALVAQNGVGIAMLPTFVAAPFIAAGSLVTILPKVDPARLHIYAAYASRRHMSSVLRALLDCLAEQLPPEPAWDAALDLPRPG